jgi:integrase
MPPAIPASKRITGLWERRLADGSVVYETQARIDGKVRRVVHRDAVTKTEAILAHKKLTVGDEEGEVKVGDRSLTMKALVEDFLARERGVLGQRTARTIDLYEQRLNDHVLPHYGTMKADDLRIQHVRAVDKLKAKGRSGSTIKGVVTALSMALQHGERHLGTPTRNVCRDLGRGELPSNQRTTEPRYLSVAQAEKLLAAMPDVTRPIASACFYGGLRISEARALVWADVDFDAATISVKDAATKTHASKPTIPLLPALARELRAHRERQREIGIHRIAPGGLVFQSAKGKPLSRRVVLRGVNKASVDTGLVAEGQEKVGVHDFRHSLAANAFALGLAPTEVARLLRHANPGVTLAVYAGISDEAATARGGELAAAGFGS